MVNQQFAIENGPFSSLFDLLKMVIFQFANCKRLPEANPELVISNPPISAESHNSELLGGGLPIGGLPIG